MFMERGDKWMTCNCFIKILVEDPDTGYASTEVACTNTVFNEPKYSFLHVSLTDLVLNSTTSSWLLERER